MAVYEEMLAELKRGVKISKPFGSLSEGTDIVISQGAGFCRFTQRIHPDD